MRKPTDWDQPCPNPDCPYYRLMNQGNISAISTYLTQSGKWRIFRCNACDVTFSETRDPVFFALRTPEEKVMMALKTLLVKVGLSPLAFPDGPSRGAGGRTPEARLSPIMRRLSRPRMAVPRRAAC